MREMKVKSNLDSVFKTDKAVEETGVWFNIDSKTGFLIRPFSAANPTIKAAMAKFFKPYAYQIDHGTLDAEKEREISVKVFVHACVVDWKGVEIDGKEVAFDKESAIKLFVSLPELYKTLMRYAEDFRNYKVEDPADKEIVGNC